MNTNGGVEITPCLFKLAARLSDNSCTVMSSCAAGEDGRNRFNGGADD